MHILITTQLEHSIATLTAVRADASIVNAVAEAGQLIANAMKKRNKLMVAGNGGSAADSQHLVAEFVSRLTRDRPALPAVALTTNTSILTAIGNDFSYDDVFERQVEAIGVAGDVFLGISTSGNSRNLIKALTFCRQNGIATVGFLGNNGEPWRPCATFRSSFRRASRCKSRSRISHSNTFFVWLWSGSTLEKPSRMFLSM